MKYLKNVTTLKFFQEKCTSCGHCIEVCPHEVFVKEEKKVLLKNIDHCMECGACYNNCEFDAIEVESGVGCAAALINAKFNGGVANCGCSGDDSTECC